MTIEDRLLDSFKKLYERQEELSKLTDSKLFDSFSNSEVHVVDIIGSKIDVNGIKLAKDLDMTRGAISKIIAKLKDKGAVETYQKKDNKKEIYYNLTDYGQEIYNSHKKAHMDWEKREKEFFKEIKLNELEIVDEFLIKYNTYLDKLIKERS